mmetsp:Transcript_35130/g.100912  ORF Transcript_35130/g.100912 Transcript_35130/m.100912 type:complete len:171 (+) Transcript_35130:63-575(+)
MAFLQGLAEVPEDGSDSLDDLQEALEMNRKLKAMLQQQPQLKPLMSSSASRFPSAPPMGATGGMMAARRPNSEASASADLARRGGGFSFQEPSKASSHVSSHTINRQRREGSIGKANDAMGARLRSVKSSGLGGRPAAKTGPQTRGSSQPQRRAARPTGMPRMPQDEWQS